MRRQRVGVLFVVIAMSAALLMLSGPAMGVTFGDPDEGEHPYVGLVYLETPDGVYRCSGALIHPEVVLTAGHCTETRGVVNTRTWVTFDEEVIIPDDVLELPDDEFGDWLDGNSDFVKGQAVPHPKYDDFAEFPVTYDIGVVILDKAVNGLGSASLPTGDVLGSVRGQDKVDQSVLRRGTCPLQGRRAARRGAQLQHRQGYRLREVHQLSGQGQRQRRVMLR
jgi:hypothetical protein